MNLMLTEWTGLVKVKLSAHRAGLTECWPVKEKMEELLVSLSAGEDNPEKGGTS